MKPLFIPLKTEYYRAFESGAKTVEYRKHGDRWNRETCVAGRSVVLSKGYGKHERLNGEIAAYSVVAAEDLPDEARTAFYGCYPLSQPWSLVGCIEVKVEKPLEVQG